MISKKIIIKNIIPVILIMIFFGLSTSDALGASVFDNMKGAIKGFDLPSGGDDAEGKLLDAAGKLIGAFLSLLGIVFFGLMLYGGWKWMMASGKDEEINTAKSIIRSAIIGLSIIIAAYAITYFVTNALQSAVK